MLDLDKIKSENLSTLSDVRDGLKIDFEESRELRFQGTFDSKDKEYFMTRCKQGEGVVSAIKNSLETIKVIERVVEKDGEEE